MREADSAFLACAVIATAVAVAAGTCEQARAQDRHDRELALAVARLTVNESGWHSPADGALIWQVVQGRGTSSRERLAWLRRHSPRVMGARPCAGGNCAWTAYLDGDRRPRGYPEGAAWVPARWRAVRAQAEALVGGTWEGALPCPRAPMTWDARAGGAEGRGWRPVGCIGTRNEGYTR